MEGRRGDGWVREGDEAPLFELPDTEFKPVSPIKTATKGLAFARVVNMRAVVAAISFTENMVVLAFFPAAFSGSLDGGCECQMRTLHEEFSELAKHEDLTLFGIGRELPFAMSAWGEKIGLGFPLLSDPNLVVAEAFVGVCDLGGMLASRTGNSGLKGYLSPNRGVVVIDAGKVVYKWVGKNAKTGMSDPSILPDLAPVKEALSRGRSRL